ncbi:hypothetical protein [Gluconobacter japonicus]|uniref:hypothetical protein n=1 Tax=Gluconobacter japonicus TaxID=376620 RepID=UPI001D170C9F|nr:hypothetical protein [Gluconobacter japonicus]
MSLRYGIFALLFAPGLAAAQVVHPEHVPAMYPAPGSTLQEFVGIGSVQFCCRPIKALPCSL